MNIILKEGRLQCCAGGASKIISGERNNADASYDTACQVVSVQTIGSAAPYAGERDISGAKECPNITCSIGPAQGVPALNCCANGANDSGAK